LVVGDAIERSLVHDVSRVGVTRGSGRHLYRSFGYKTTGGLRHNESVFRFISAFVTPPLHSVRLSSLSLPMLISDANFGEPLQVSDGGVSRGWRMITLTGDVLAVSGRCIVTNASVRRCPKYS
jgi:hypothetical protein